MTRIILAALALFAVQAQAAPFLVGDICTAEIDTCVYTNNAAAKFEFPVVVDPVRGISSCSNRICLIDLGPSPAGTNNVKLAAKSTLWGLTSVDVPFSFAKPTTATVPASLRLLP